MPGIVSPDFRQVAEPPKAQAQPKPKANFPTGAEIKRNRLMIRRGTEQNVSPKDILTSYEMTPEKGDTGAVKEQYRRALENYSATILEMSKKPSLGGSGSRLDDMTAMPVNQHIKALLDLAGKTEFDAEGNKTGVTLDADKIAKLLDDETGRGMQFVTGFLSHENARKMFVLGLYTRVGALSEKDLGVGPSKTPLGEEEPKEPKKRKVLDRLFGEKPEAFSSQEQVLEDAWQRHQVLEQQRFREAFELTQLDPNEATYLKEAYQVDVNDFEMTTQRKLWWGQEIDVLRVKSGRLPETINPQGIVNEAKQEFVARALYYNQTLGVPLSEIDGSPEQRIIEYSLGNSFQTYGDKFLERVTYEFQPNNGGIRDTWGQSTNDPEFLRYQKTGPKPTDIPKPSVVHLDRKGNIIRFQRARRVAIVMLGQEILNEQRTEKGKEKATRRVSTLKTQVESFNHEAEKTKRTKEAKEKRDKLDAQRKEITESQRHQLYKDYDEKGAAAKQHIRQFVNEYDLKDAGGNPLTLNTSTTEFSEAVDRQIVSIEGTLVTPIAEFNAAQLAYDALVHTESIRLINERRAANRGKELPNDVIAAIEASAKRIADQSPDGKKLARLGPIISEGREQIAALKGAKARYRELVSERASVENLIMGMSDKQLTEMRDAYVLLVDLYHGQPGALTSRDELRNLSTDQLVERASQPPYNLPNGTEEERAKIRKTALLARSEYLGQEQSKYDPSPPAEVRFYREVIDAGGTLHPNDLLNMSDSQLLPILTAPPYSSPPYSWSAANAPIRLLLARSEARRQLLTRNKLLMEEQVKDLDSQIKSQDKVLENADEEIKKVEAYKKGADLLRTRQGDILLNADDIVTDTTGRFFDTAVVTATDKGFTKDEIALGAEKGYYELMDYFFDYRLAPDRDERFKWIQEALTPARLLEMFQKPPLSLKNGWGIVVPTLNQALTELAAQRSLLGEQKLRQAFIQMINETVDEAIIK